MQLTHNQFKQISHVMLRLRGNVIIKNLQALNAILYVAEHGCKWRGLPKKYGNWHTIYTRMNHWAGKGVLERVFNELQKEQAIQLKVGGLSPDSTTVKVHPDGTGVSKKTACNP